MARKQKTSQREASEFVLEAKDLHRIYTVGDIQVPALNGVNLQIRPGEFVVILGVSGSGKSTLLSLLGGLDRPTEGSVLIEGQDLSQMSDDQLADLRLHKVGFIFQFFNLMPQLTAQANVELPLFLAEIPSEKAQERSQELLDLVGLTQRANHRPTELSGGEQQRVAIARALANNPTIILADEPTGNLDTKTGKEIIKLLREVNQTKNQTFIVVGHDQRLKTVADRIIEMEDGRFIRKQEKRGMRER
ncbi:MAG: ABC transporter ATP-binding protein [Promethearchaeota archaeon]